MRRTHYHLGFSALLSLVALVAPVVLLAAELAQVPSARDVVPTVYQISATTNDPRAPIAEFERQVFALNRCVDQVEFVVARDDRRASRGAPWCQLGGVAVGNAVR